MPDSARKEFLVFGSPAIEEEEIAEVVATLRSGWLSTGPRTIRFQDDFRRYIGCQHALALSSCTAGLHLALDALGIGVGDEVITTPITFAATANVIVHRGATPVFADVERTTMNIDPVQIEKAITPKTKAIIPVHLAGRPCRMDRIMDLARRGGSNCGRAKGSTGGGRLSDDGVGGRRSAARLARFDSAGIARTRRVRCANHF